MFMACWYMAIALKPGNCSNNFDGCLQTKGESIESQVLARTFIHHAQKWPNLKNEY